MIDDAMNLALTGRLDYRTALDVTSYLAHERSYVPWKAGLSALGYIDSMLSKGAHYLEYGVSSVRMLNFYYLFSLVLYTDEVIIINNIIILIIIVMGYLSKI